MEEESPGLRLKRLSLRALRLVAIALAAFYLLVCGAAFGFQRALLYPKPPPAALPGEPGAALRIPAGTSEVLAWHIPAAEGRPTIVSFHGNGEQLADLASIGASYSRHGIGFLAVEYPGYGLAPGETTEESVYAAAERALSHAAKALGISRSRTILEGRSLGTGVAIEMARRGHGAALVLVAPYTSMAEMASLTLPFVPASLLLRDRFESVEKVPSIALPSLVAHGSSDELIPVAMGERICARLRRCELIRFEGWGHELIGDSSPGGLTARVAEFAARVTQ